MLAGEVLKQLQDKANLDIAYKSLNSFFYRNAFTDFNLYLIVRQIIT